MTIKHDLTFACNVICKSSEDLDQEICMMNAVIMFQIVVKCSSNLGSIC